MSALDKSWLDYRERQRLQLRIRPGSRKGKGKEQQRRSSLEAVVRAARGCDRAGKNSDGDIPVSRDAQPVAQFEGQSVRSSPDPIAECAALRPRKSRARNNTGRARTAKIFAGIIKLSTMSVTTDAGAAARRARGEQRVLCDLEREQGRITRLGDSVPPSSTSPRRFTWRSRSRMRRS